MNFNDFSLAAGYVKISQALDELCINAIRFLAVDAVAIGISRFGTSALGQVIYHQLGLTPQSVVDAAIAANKVPGIIAAWRRSSPSSLIF